MQDSANVEYLKPFSKLLPCKLSNEELLERGQQLGAVTQDIADEEARQVSIKQELKARLTELESQRMQLATQITRREEMREVEIVPERDYTLAKYYEIRQDTGEVVKERPLTPEERQLGLPKPE